MTLPASLLQLVAALGDPQAAAADDKPVELAQANVAVTQPATPPAADAAPVEPLPGESADDPLLPGRRVPGEERELPDAVTQDNVGAVRAPPPQAFPIDQIPVPDRWRLVETLGVVRERWLDPYHQNTYKGDRPICISTEEEQERRRKLREEAEAAGQPPPHGSAPCITPKILGLKADDWFFAVNAISDTIIEPRSFPIPVGVQTTERPGSNDVFGKNDAFVAAQTFIVGAALIKGSTAYKPPDYEYRATLAFNVNYADVSERRILFVEPSKGTSRVDSFIGVQELFVDKHLRNVSDRYDFDSIRIGIQPFQFDFRGFLFQDQQLGIRLFGTRDNNRFQYNIAVIDRLEKDTNSGLNDVTELPREDYIVHANLFRQDFPFVGLTSMASITYNANRDANKVEIDDNGFPVIPALIGNLRARDYDVVYFGYGVDGRIGRMNLSAQVYYAWGEDRDNIFNGRAAEIKSLFFAAEPSYDIDFIRVRGAFL